MDTHPIASPVQSLPKRRCILVCQHRSCSRSQAAEVLEAFQAQAPLQVFATASDCMGQCASGPTVRVMPDGLWYCRVKPEDVATIVEQHLQADQPVEALLHSRFHPRDDAYSDFYPNSYAEQS